MAYKTDLLVQSPMQRLEHDLHPWVALFIMPVFYGVSWLAGIGFTMSLFIASLAFGETPLLPVAKVGILTGSLIAGVVGWMILRGTRPVSAGNSLNDGQR
jgi:Na+/H+ antiporter NhaA